MRFNDSLKALRQNKDLTQDALAKDLNIDRQTLSNYETSYKTPSIYLVIKIADFFNVSTDFLLCRTDIQSPYPKIHK